MISSTVWQVTIGILGAVIIFDLILAILHRKKETTPKEALSWTLFYVVSAIAFGYLLPQWAPPEYRKEFIAGWLTEYSLSVDNLFEMILTVLLSIGILPAPCGPTLTLYLETNGLVVPEMNVTPADCNGEM